MNQRAGLDWIGAYAWLKKHHIMKKMCSRYGENPVLEIFTVGKKNTSF